MSVADMRLTCEIKAIFTRHWIDQKELNVSVHGGSVRLRGELRRLASSEHGSVDTSVLMEIVCEIQRLRGVQKVYFLDVTVSALDDKVTARTLEDDSPQGAEVNLGEVSRFREVLHHKAFLLPGQLPKGKRIN